MRIITHDDGRCLTLRLLGELDHAAAQEVMPGIEDAVEEYLPRRCVLDLHVQNVPRQQLDAILPQLLLEKMKWNTNEALKDAIMKVEHAAAQLQAF